MRTEIGFTLIELMVVIAIVGILASVAIPMFIEYRMQARDGVALSDARNTLAIMVAAQR